MMSCSHGCASRIQNSMLPIWSQLSAQLGCEFQPSGTRALMIPLQLDMVSTDTTLVREECGLIPLEVGKFLTPLQTSCVITQEERGESPCYSHLGIEVCAPSLVPLTPWVRLGGCWELHYPLVRKKFPSPQLVQVPRADCPKCTSLTY